MREPEPLTEDLKKLVFFFLKSIIVVSFILFILSWYGIEFNTYPHKIIKLNGNDIQFYEGLVICSDWLDINNPVIRLDFSNLGATDCNLSSWSWRDFEKDRINFRANYQIIVRDVYEFGKEIEIEIIYLKRAFIVHKGKGYFYE